MASGILPKIPQDVVILRQSNKMQSCEVSSQIANGWVLRLDGYDISGTHVAVGFDRTGGIYCYYNGQQVWNIRP